MNPELRRYLKEEILPKYDQFDEGHNRTHVDHVTRTALNLAEEYGADKDLVEVIAVYHDVGLAWGREEHHLFSGKILRNDNTLKKWFSPEQIELMAQAVEDHRGSSKAEPRSLYGKIVADADREYSPERLIDRSLCYGRKHYPSLTTEQQYQRVWEHCKNKYGSDGYVHFYLKSVNTDQELARLHALLLDRDAFFELCRKVDQK